MKEGSVRIIGLGESVPFQNELVINEQVLEMLRKNGIDTKRKTGEDTEKLVGIKTRWWSSMTSTEHALFASDAALKDAKEKTKGQFNESKLGLIHSGGSSPDWVFPSCACQIHGFLEIPNGNCEARDISLACSSFVDALILANSRMRHKNIHYGLVAVGESIGTRLNAPTSLNYCLWGDGGGAVVLEYDPKGDPNFGIIADKVIADGQYAYWTKSHKLGCHPDTDNYEWADASMEGHEKDIHRYGCRIVPQLIEVFLDECDIEGECQYLLPHNANLSMALEIGKRICLREDRVLTRIQERGNTSSASIPITLDYYVRQNKFQTGDLLILAAFGGGMAVDLLLYRWG